MEQALQKQYIMKGKSRHLFWPFLAFLVLSEAVGFISNVMRFQILRSAGFGPALAVILAVAAFVFVGWAVFLLFYWLKVDVRLYKVLLAILMFTEIPAVTSGVLSGINYLTILGGNYSQPSVIALGISASALALFSRAAWVVCLLIIAFSSKAGAPLRVSAGVLALFSLYMIVYSLLSGVVTQQLASRFGIQTYTTINTVITVVNEAAFIGLHAFFFGAMSFSKQRQPKVPAQSGGVPA